jgi:shikimate dehydrogenase
MTRDRDRIVAGVVGHPIGHSLSPAIHTAALSHGGMNAVYLAFDIPPEGFGAFVEGMIADGARGLSVTVPHKRAAYDLADELSETAERAGAVNTLVFDEHRVAGHNTDVTGIRRALAELGVEWASSRVLVIGAGGAGRAAAVAVAGAASVSVANRTGARADEVAGLIAGGRSVRWSDLGNAAAASDVIVHATSVGLDGESSVLDAEAIERAAAGGCSVLLDLVYGRDETPLVGLARQSGLRAADGLGVLVYQAEEAYELLWGRRPAEGVMLHAALQASGRNQ